MMPKSLSPFIPLLLLLSTPLSGEEIVGAEAVLRRLSEPSTEASQPKDPATAFKLLLENYQRESGELPPEKAAAGWLTLLDAYQALPQDLRMRSYASSELSTGALLRALPPSHSWDALASALQKRAGNAKGFRASAQNLLGAILASDPAGRLPALNQLKEIATNDPTMDQFGSSSLENRFAAIEEQILSNNSSSMDDVKRLSRELDKAIKDGSTNYMTLEIPRLPDSPAAREILLRVLKSGMAVRFDDEDTRQLAIDLAKEHLAGLPAPPWNFIRSVEDIPLLEAALALHPTDVEGTAIRQEMASQFLREYLENGEEAKALSLIEQPRKTRTIFGTRTGYRGDFQPGEKPLSKEAGTLLLKINLQALRNDPNRPYWNATRELARQYGELAEFKKALGNSLADPRLTAPKIRNEIEDILLIQLLDEGKVDEGIHLLQQLIASVEKPTNVSPPEAGKENALPAPAESLSGVFPESGTSRHAELLEKAIQIGRLFGRTELIDSALETYSHLLPRLSSLPYHEIIWETYLERDMAWQLEKALSDRLIYLAGNDKEQSNLASILVRLAWLYERLGRHKDVILLLDEAPYWNMDDLIGRNSYETNSDLMLIAAKAMKGEGKTAKALEITRYLLVLDPDSDKVYTLLFELNPPDLADILDQTAVANRFQERPLIWKAKLLLNQGKIGEAESTVKKAISIDPSDGEQGKGNRMRAYEVLADILEKKGDAEQTKFFRNVVAAIRLSETADDWWAAGLTATAIGIYEKSLQSFADAYCIQSRLALRYASEGNMEKAILHYQRAFELMPDSFGRIESHCFGCEGAFKGEAAQSIAEKVFTDLAAKPDAKAQVFYLLGYLRNTQNRYQEAEGFFRKAVTMDPDYVNAWSKLAGLFRSVKMTGADQDEIAFNLFRLTSAPESISAAHDLRRMWDTLLAAEKAMPPVPATLYPLPATKEKLATQGNRHSRYYQDSDQRQPRELFLRHPLISAVTSVLDVSMMID